jgi:hypothetical protein
MSDYTYWQNALAGTFGPVHDSDPQFGFYRKRTGKSAGYEPVAIFENAGVITALVNGKPADAEEIWTFVCQYPIPEAWYRLKMDGQPWPDEDLAVTESLAHDTRNSVDVSEDEKIKDQIDTAMKGIEDYAVINDDETATKAQAKRSRLLDLSGEADKKREAAKAPHLEAGRKVDALWNPMVKMAKEAADKIRAAMSAHELRKRNAEIAAQKKADEDKIAADKLAAKNAKKGLPAPAPAPAAPSPPIEVPKAQIRGGYGRAAAVILIKKATVVDQDKAYMAMRTHPELVALIALLAQRAAKAGIPVDGVTVQEEPDVR